MSPNVSAETREADARAIEVMAIAFNPSWPEKPAYLPQNFHETSATYRRLACLSRGAAKVQEALEEFEGDHYALCDAAVAGDRTKTFRCNCGYAELMDAIDAMLGGEP